MNQTIKVMIADDHMVVRQGLRALIATEQDMRVVGEADNGVEAINKAASLEPDIIIMDVRMASNGINAIQEIRKRNSRVRILVLSAFRGNSKVREALESGAMGYIMKDQPPDEILCAIRRTYADKSSFHPCLSVDLKGHLRHCGMNSKPKGGLSNRETQVIGLVAAGLSNQEIAARLSISLRTVQAHLVNAQTKLCLKSRAQLQLYALRENCEDLVPTCSMLSQS
jgi:DNA-binding NarL/FixJ family response regulator